MRREVAMWERPSSHAQWKAPLERDNPEVGDGGLRATSGITPAGTRGKEEKGKGPKQE